MSCLPTRLTVRPGQFMPGSVRNDDGATLPPDPRASIDSALRMVWRRKWLILLVAIPVLLAGLGYLLIATEQYTAHATLMVGFRQSELATAEQSHEPVQGDPDIDGAIELIQGQPVLRHVALTLDLQSHPESG